MAIVVISACTHLLPDVNLPLSTPFLPILCRPHLTATGHLSQVIRPSSYFKLNILCSQVNSYEVIEWVNNPLPLKEYREKPCNATFSPSDCTVANCGPLAAEHNGVCTSLISLPINSPVHFYISVFCKIWVNNHWGHSRKFLLRRIQYISLKLLVKGW